MRKQESYWTYKAPDLSDLPPGTFYGDEAQWRSLSPGFRRQIYRDALRRQASAAYLNARIAEAKTLATRYAISRPAYSAFWRDVAAQLTSLE